MCDRTGERRCRGPLRCEGNCGRPPLEFGFPRSGNGFPRSGTAVLTAWSGSPRESLRSLQRETHLCNNRRSLPFSLPFLIHGRWHSPGVEAGVRIQQFYFILFFTKSVSQRFAKTYNNVALSLIFIIEVFLKVFLCENETGSSLL